MPGFPWPAWRSSITARSKRLALGRKRPLRSITPPSRLKSIISSLPAAASNSDCRRPFSSRLSRDSPTHIGTAWYRTTTPHVVLMLTVLGGLAEFKRTLIKARIGEGRERPKGRGVRFGRPLKLSAHQRREAIERLDAGDAVVDVARASFHWAETRRL
jgi:hypothetical protein